MTSRKVAVVTGSNRGLGFAIVKGLCEKFDGDVFLTARAAERGQEAVEELRKLGFNPLFHQLDIADQASVDVFRDHIKDKYGGIDVIVNNAAIPLGPDAPGSVAFKAKERIRVNYYGALRLCDALFPLLRQNGHVVNITSAAGHLSQMKTASLREKFADKNLTIDGLNRLMEQYVQDAVDGKNVDEIWGSSYSVSKVAITCFSIIQQRDFEAEVPNRNIFVNAVHPGRLNTETDKSFLTHDEGAKAPIFLALEANLKGQYVWRDCSVNNWYSPALIKPDSIM